MKTPEERSYALTTAAGYERGAAETDKIATGLEAAVIMLAQLGPSKSSDVAAALEKAGFAGDLSELQEQALEVVKLKAASERSIADHMVATADELKGSVPPPPPGPAPAGLGHPETNGGAGFFTR